MTRLHSIGIAAAAIAGAIAITACTHLAPAGPADGAASTLPGLPADGMAMVYVVRPSPLRARVPMAVTVDGDTTPVGTTRGGEYIYFALAPGRHRIASHAENVAEADVRVQAGEVVFMRQVPAVGIESARNSLVRIDADVGRHHVAKLAPGELHTNAALR